MHSSVTLILKQICVGFQVVNVNISSSLCLRKPKSRMPHADNGAFIQSPIHKHTVTSTNTFPNLHLNTKHVAMIFPACSPPPPMSVTFLIMERKRQYIPELRERYRVKRILLLIALSGF